MVIRFQRIKTCKNKIVSTQGRNLGVGWVGVVIHFQYPSRQGTKRWCAVLWGNLFNQHTVCEGRWICFRAVFAVDKEFVRWVAHGICLYAFSVFIQFVEVGQLFDTRIRNVVLGMDLIGTLDQ